ncbi:nuclear transport factor 2 family protein [Marinobacterium mangrovicola]|uniref:SnoaL-like protein n=1 Tax=Marinobacterium mangrovicola TaxID=1476959 RepID=A0A4R1GM18_9GAMM|nr:nuclear transport factor 2 family protein [Marinobacterium mangrovicola]TCK08123.1 SnoaL-like protein [Marinobacterium mangrovicola]
MSDAQQTLDLYCQAFEQLTPENVDQLEALVSRDIHFRDPFNDVTGWSAMRAVLVDMFEHCDNPGFTLTERLADEQRAYLRWIFTAKISRLGEFNIDGVSRLSFDADGRITEHLDFWDSSPLYLRLPLVGWLLRKVKKRISAGA